MFVEMLLIKIKHKADIFRNFHFHTGGKKVDQGPCQASMIEFFAENFSLRLRSLTRKISGKVCSGKLPVGKFILAVF